MGNYGRFIGGTHFKKLKNRKFNPKKVKHEMVTQYQIDTLKLLGLSFQLNSMSRDKATKLIEKLQNIKNENKH